jgi:hypothetical protein
VANKLSSKSNIIWLDPVQLKEEFFSCGKRRAVATRKIKGSNPFLRFIIMKCNIISVGSYGSTVYLGMNVSKSAIKNIGEVLINLKLEFAEDFVFRCDSRGEPIVDYNPKEYVDDHSFFESKKFKVHVIVGTKKIHIIAVVTKKYRDMFLTAFQKYFEVVKPK